MSTIKQGGGPVVLLSCYADDTPLSKEKSVKWFEPFQLNNYLKFACNVTKEMVGCFKLGCTINATENLQSELKYILKRTPANSLVVEKWLKLPADSRGYCAITSNI